MSCKPNQNKTIKHKKACFLSPIQEKIPEFWTDLSISGFGAMMYSFKFVCVWIIFQGCETLLYVSHGYATYWTDIWKIHVTYIVSSFGENFWIPTTPKRKNLWKPFDLPRWRDQFQPLLISKQDTSCLPSVAFGSNLTLNLIHRRNIELQGAYRERSREMDPSLHYTLEEVLDEGMNQNIVLRSLSGCKNNAMHRGVSSLED